MPAYMVILAEIHDLKAFMAYAGEAAQLIAKFGGKYIVRGAQQSECLEGDWPDETKVVISRWPSFEAAKAFWNSDEYSEVKKLRLGNATVRVRLVETAV